MIDIDLSTWVPVIAALLGVSVGGILGFVGSWLQFRRETAWQEAQDRRRLVERVFSVVQEVRKSMIFAGAKAAIQVSAGQKLDLQTDWDPVPEMVMLVRVYFRTLTPEVERVVRARDALLEKLLSCTLNPPQSGDREAAAGELTQITGDLVDAIQGLEKALMRVSGGAVPKGTTRPDDSSEAKP